jgi:DNA polymerase-4
MDAFYASVEARDRPELAGRPLVVGGTPDGRGVVAAASYAARAYGVRSAMPAAQARRLCPDAVFLRPDFAKYRAVSNRIRAVFTEVTDRIEPLALDEAYLDVTHHRADESSGGRIARRIKARIREATGLASSAGVGPNKLVAKLASDFDKPDGLVIVAPDRVDAFLTPLPARRLWGVGPKTAARLAELGIETVGDLRSRTPEELAERFGRYGSLLWDLAHGRDEREVVRDRAPRSRGQEVTLEVDELDPAPLAAWLERHAERVAADLERHELVGRTITLKVRYASFRTVTRSRTLRQPTRDAVRIAEVATALMAATDIGRKPVRLIGLSVSQLEAGRGGQPQLSLF